MYQNYKVVICIPAGRQRYLEIIKKFLYRKIEDGLIDEIQLWQNTVNPTDIAYLESMQAESPKVKIYKLDEAITPTWESYNALQTHKFMKFAQDDDTIYIRLDDDIVWVEEGALEKICQARIDNPDAFIIYPNVINSTMCTSWHQENGALSEEAGIVRKESQHPEDKDWAYLDAFNYTDSGLIDHIHKTFVKRYNENSLSAYYLPSKSFEDYKHFSICSIAWWGKDKIDCGSNEEAQMAWELPMKFKRPVFFCGNALMLHSSYHTQRDYLETVRKPYYLDFFRDIANGQL
jgi:hypothetical protein